ncbi:type IV toxin-antitoxin system AbiEi family antitoxin domain-containing protein [Microbacterium sp. NPDC055903]
MSSAATVLRRLGSVARTRRLRASGVSRRAIARAVATGAIIRIRQGVYALPDAPDALAHAAMHGGTPACLTAGRLLGLWILPGSDPYPLHVWLGAGGEPHGCRRSGCSDMRIHWDEGCANLGSPPPVKNVLLQIAICADEDTFFAALESALRMNLLEPGALIWLGWRLPPERRWLLAFARSDADSGLESLIRIRLHRLGLAVRCQVVINGVGEVDLVLGERLIIEADGKENHEGAAQRHKDLLRDARAAALGYETLRFDYAMIVHDWATVEAAILAKVAEGAHLRP